MQALFADTSRFQPASIGASYWLWTRAGDGVARLVCKASEGVGYKDANFEGYWHQAMIAQAGMVGVYHYARADLNPGPAGAAKEAQWFAQVVNKRLFPEDRLMLDFEQNESATWAHAFHDALQAAYSRPVKPVLYDSVSHFTRFFAGDLALAAKYDLALAAYHPRVQGPPPAPPGWNMLWWQYSSSEGVPGVGSCDANVWLGGASQMAVPKGPFYTIVVGKDVPNGTPFKAIGDALGLDEASLKSINPGLATHDWNMAGNIDGDTVQVPGWQLPSPPPQPSKADVALAALKAAWEG